MLCPMIELYDGSFSQNPEPNTWRETVDTMLDNYKDLIGIKETLMIKADLGVLNKDDMDRLTTVTDSMNAMVPLMVRVKKVEDTAKDIINSDSHINK